MNLSSPRAVNIIYWTSTAIVAAIMTMSGTMQLTAEEAKKGLAAFGFPDYFRIELGIAKLLGVVALLAPVPRWTKEWAYAGFFIVLVSAMIAHYIMESPAKALGPFPFLILLLVSRVYWGKRHATLQR